MRFLELVRCGLFATAAVFAHPVTAKSVAPSFIPVGETADAPAGFVEMCARNAQLCQIGADPNLPPMERSGASTDQLGLSASGTGAIVNSHHDTSHIQKDDTAPIIVNGRTSNAQAQQTQKQLYKMLKAVNGKTNRDIYQASDIRAFGVGELWQRPAGRYLVGDCEDIAIEKRIRLMEMGFPASNLFYAVVYHPVAGLHTVLIARMEAGDFVLDNITPHILHWSETRFSWLRQQTPGHPENWARIADTKLS